jgi:hypothetical protein
MLNDKDVNEPITISTGVKKGAKSKSWEVRISTPQGQLVLSKKGNGSVPGKIEIPSGKKFKNQGIYRANLVVEYTLGDVVRTEDVYFQTRRAAIRLSFMKMAINLRNYLTVNQKLSLKRLDVRVVPTNSKKNRIVLQERLSGKLSYTPEGRKDTQISANNSEMVLSSENIVYGMVPSGGQPVEFTFDFPDGSRTYIPKNWPVTIQKFTAFVSLTAKEGDNKYKTRSVQIKKGENRAIERIAGSAKLEVFYRKDFESLLPQFRIRGLTNRGNRIKVGNTEVKVNKRGTFEVTIQLERDAKKIKYYVIRENGEEDIFLDDNPYYSDENLYALGLRLGIELSSWVDGSDSYVPVFDLYLNHWIDPEFGFQLRITDTFFGSAPSRMQLNLRVGVSLDELLEGLRATPFFGLFSFGRSVANVTSSRQISKVSTMDIGSGFEYPINDQIKLFADLSFLSVPGSGTGAKVTIAGTMQWKEAFDWVGAVDIVNISNLPFQGADNQVETQISIFAGVQHRF